jgi:3-hydroxymyristoyl/3-hydroxydecanoyl-(acyl carrier protein) dehydratase
MEIALQPCGFLSAYLDTYSFVPYEVIFFRNLDGSLRFGEPFDLRGKTITTRARLINSVVSGGTVIQRFDFELTCEGRFICSGESTFGYFSPETMANQVGLDGGRKVMPWVHAGVGRLQAAKPIDLWVMQRADPGKPFYRIGKDRMQYLDDCIIDPQGGAHGKGYVYASRPVNPADWFYPFHFFQDPVMPGSLGVEAMLEAIQAYAIDQSLGTDLRSPRIRTMPGTAPMTWRYRGQIIPQNALMELEAHLSEIRHEPGRVAISADASLWVDGLRIYELKNASVEIFEG